MIFCKYKKSGQGCAGWGNTPQEALDARNRAARCELLVARLKAEDCEFFQAIPIKVGFVTEEVVTTKKVLSIVESDS